MKTDSTVAVTRFCASINNTLLLPANLLFPFTMFKNRRSLSDPSCAQCETAHKSKIVYFLTMAELNRSLIPLSTPFFHSALTVWRGPLRVSLCFSRRFALQRSALYRPPLPMSNIFFELFSFFFSPPELIDFSTFFKGRKSYNSATCRSGIFFLAGIKRAG